MVLLDSSALQLVDALRELVRIWCEPLVTHDCREVRATSWVGDQHDGEEIASLLRDIVREGERGIDDVLVQQVDVVAIRVSRVIVEGEVARQHCV